MANVDCLCIGQVLVDERLPCSVAGSFDGLQGLHVFLQPLNKIRRFGIATGRYKKFTGQSQ